MILGIDIGGTSVKYGIVSPNGEISDYSKYDTKELLNLGFIDCLKRKISDYLSSHPGISGIGIGFPGLLSADRRKVILMPNIPGIVDVDIVGILNQEFPGITIKIENDAKCAALGEHYFGQNKGLDNFIVVTLGTGIGSGAIMNKQLFLGARGNGTEIGHMLTRNGKTLEQEVGLTHLLAYAKEVFSDVPSADTKLDKSSLTMLCLCEAAGEGDVYAKKVFSYLGSQLGENMVSVIRVLDINTILLGGGISAAFEFILPAMKSTLLKNLPAYYTDSLQIKRAALSNEAGLLGAAGLIMNEHKVFADSIKC
ncbi:MAG: ROK family protein [Cytophagaceae bacterium]